jgi:ketosteroid isomerase-like protein
MKNVEFLTQAAISTLLLAFSSFAGFTLTQIADRGSAVNSSDNAAKLASAASAGMGAPMPEDLFRLLGERIVARDLDGIVALHEPRAVIVNYDLSVIKGRAAMRTFYADWLKSNPLLKVNLRQVTLDGGDKAGCGTVRHQTASVMGGYTLEQTAPDGTRETLSGDFCDLVRQQADGTWLYIQRNPYPAHGDAAAVSAAHH